MCDTRLKIIRGSIVKIGDSVIGWKSNKQKLVALSTMEFELLSLCDAVSKRKCLMGLLEELNQGQMTMHPLEIGIDSQCVIDWIKNSRMNNRKNHIDRKFHFVKYEIR